ncbi:hypothetical protein [Hymenobacter sp. PAMC 26628]|uniref:hypothetical protein n=1 Tax=Hymenobacter sp. PAMC 26628 TaxID=1484118 RepID=UPI0012FFCD8B|nr:hypothetical protein [Hymenobacter sp. PAMC 26628]
MKNFIEVPTSDGKRLINTNAIVQVRTREDGTTHIRLNQGSESSFVVANLDYASVVELIAQAQ